MGEATGDRTRQGQPGTVDAGHSRIGPGAAGDGGIMSGACPSVETDSKSEGDRLVARAKAGDAGAFEALLALHYRFMFRVACRWTGNRADAEDVTQTVCMRLGETIRSFDGRASFQGWLYRVTLNAVRDQQRATARRGRLAAAAALLSDEVRQGDQEDALHVADIWRAVRALPEKQRDAILLVHGEGLAQAEAARIMGCKEVTVSWHIHQARKALRGVL
ncbi:RNA polymerase sigma factor [Pseudogemmobacter bohemicus]|uniref:RNA polymerase sigma factor n=1 Tax=Pseudogemmobacter bohemicus TaxID=2250708 RepID=UPI0018E57139|nr:RNA polymerase sigma factor [Pseudogemmobacter bohemicus]